MTQATVAVRTSAQGIVYTGPSLSVQFRHWPTIANGVHDVMSELPFQLLVANFTTWSRTLSNGATIAYAKRDPLALLASDEEMARRVRTALHISEQTSVTVGCV